MPGTGKKDTGKKPAAKTKPAKKNASETGESVLRIAGSDQRQDKHFEREQAAEIIADLYPQLLEVCVDEEDEIDTRTVFEVLAGLTGLFIADYSTFYGHEKAMGTLQDIIDLSLNIYEDRAEADETE